jgi:hypothetical protein
MSAKIYRVFEEIEVKARLLSSYWNNFHAEISQHLPDTYQPDMDKLSEQLERSLVSLVNELRNPTLTLATTGTTSSGKSTLVNFLCGSEIVPVAVSEMSAGAVTIEYSEERFLVIQETSGASWECGEWRGISEEEIYQRLEQVMRSYIDKRDCQDDIACPQSVIGYPFRLLKDVKLDLPTATRVRIMDLPGLAYVGDEGNANVIRQCREALCIVTYNSAETDPARVRSLLQEVVEQVKSLGGSPARMLFVLNRIDIFREDRNWTESESRFVERTVADIKSQLADQLREYTEEIETLQVVKMSTRPALLALQIRDDNDNTSVEACSKADQHCNFLIDEAILDDLPRRTQSWSPHDRVRVAEELWQKSYAEEFQQNLANHITQHFPQLVIPQIIERFNIDAGNAVTEWARQTTSAILNSSEEDYKRECAKIAQIRTSLQSFLEESDKQLRKPFEDIDKKFKQVLIGQSDDDPVKYLESQLMGLMSVRPYDVLGQKLYPLYGWRREFGKGIEQVLESVAKSLESGRVSLEGANIQRANRTQVNLLERHLNRLIKVGYTGSVAENGQTREARTDDEKAKLKQLNEELNELAIHLNMVMKSVLDQISDQELSRMYQAVVELFNCHLSYIETGSNNVAPDIVIKFPESQLSKVDRQLKFNFKFQSGFAVTEGTWQESVEVEYRERVWWKLWLGKSTKHKTEYKTRSSDNAKIPSVEDLCTGWIIQAKESELEIVNQIAEWLLAQIDSLKKNVNQVQHDIIDRYQTRLDKANQEVTLDYEKKRSVWQPMQQKASNLADEFSRLGSILKEEP